MAAFRRDSSAPHGSARHGRRTRCRTLALGLAAAALLSLGGFVAPASAQAPAKPGEPLLTDDFEDISLGWLRENDSPESVVTAAYEEGYFVMRVRAQEEGEEERGGFISVPLPGRYANSSLAFEATIGEGSAPAALVASCRMQGDFERGYLAIVYPFDRTFAILKLSPDGVGQLVSNRPAAAIRRGYVSNHLELTCAGNQIRLAVNGEVVGQAQDSAYRDGYSLIGFTYDPEDPAAVGIWFDNLLVTQR